MGDSAFRDCTGLANVIIPDGLSTISYNAFEDCTNLVSVTISKSVTTIENCAFDGCDNLATFYYKGLKSEWNNIYIGASNTPITAYIQEKLICLLPTPVVNGASAVSSGVKIVWSAVDGAAKYRIFRKAGSGSWTKLADITSTAYTDKTAKSGTAYSYTGRCLSSDGKYFTSAYDTSGKTIMAK